MTEDMLWDIFAESGRIDDYLRYSAVRDEKDADIGRDSYPGTSGGRTG